ncbi:MAG: tetratricopeptide repeat protein [Deltaproteobacteria bacterium]|nr:tetratricopeptide repeat protein [Deltaproteobacteria bacterium]
MKIKARFFCLSLGVLLAACTSASVAADAQTYHDDGIRLYRSGNIPSAIIAFTKAIDLDPMFDRAYTNRGIMWMEIGEYDKSIADCDKAIEINPEQFAAYNSRGSAWRFKGDFERAVADYTTAIALNPRNAILFNNRGSAYMNKDDYSSAIADFSKAIEINSRYPMPYYNRGCALYRQGKFKESLPDLKKAMETGFNPADYPYLMLLIASQKVSEGEFKNIEKDFRKFTVTRSSNPWIRRIIVFYLHENVPEQLILTEAEREKNEQERKTRLCEAYYYLGEHRLSKGDKQGAEQYFLKAIETNAFTTVEYLNAKSMMQLMKEDKL